MVDFESGEEKKPPRSKTNPYSLFTKVCRPFFFVKYYSLLMALKKILRSNKSQLTSYIYTGLPTKDGTVKTTQNYINMTI